MQEVSSVAGATAGVVGVGKHLCGAATDFALRCMQAAAASGRVDAQGVVAPSLLWCMLGQQEPPCVALSHGPPRPLASPRVLSAGLAIATCCHHRCSWSQYCAQVGPCPCGFQACCCAAPYLGDPVTAFSMIRRASIVALSLPVYCFEQTWFVSLGFTAVDFERLCLLSSWATCGCVLVSLLQPAAIRS